MSQSGRRTDGRHVMADKRVRRRDVLVGGASLGVLAAVGCSGDPAADDSTKGVPGLGGGNAGSTGAGTGGASSSGDAGGGAGGTGGVTAQGGGSGGGGSAGTDGEPELVILGEPEISSSLWQMVTPYVRASRDGSYGTRVNIYNPADVPQRVVIQAFLPTGELVVKHVLSEAFEAQHSLHFELADYLREQRVPLPFEGSLWVGATPASGLTFMGLQGVSLDWWGPAHLASVHSMRDFGNSNHDAMWTDMIMPKAISSERYVTKIAIINASADGRSPAYVAKPEVVIRNDAGAELYRKTQPDLLPFNSVLLDVRELLGGADLAAGSAQVLDPVAGLIAYAYTFDTEYDAITNADHFFDKHFVVTLDATELFD